MQINDFVMKTPSFCEIWSGKSKEGGMYADMYQQHPEIRAPRCLTDCDLLTLQASLAL